MRLVEGGASLLLDLVVLLSTVHITFRKFRILSTCLCDECIDAYICVYVCCGCVQRYGVLAPLCQ